MKYKPKIAFFWCAGCGGCEESVIDLAEDLMLLAEHAEVIFWPVALDYKYEDVKALSDGEILASFINGAVRMDEQEEMAKLLRKKSRIVVAHGSCAHLGGVVGLANLFDREDILNRAYEEVPTVRNPLGVRPGVKAWKGGAEREAGLSGFHETVKPLDRVIQVDFYIPGCPPTPELVKEALEMVLADSPPQAGTVLGEPKALCCTCPRGETRNEQIRIKRFKRLYESNWDETVCFLNQGFICLGPATRGGCGGRCISGNMPCRGCFGPVGKVRDQGAGSLSFLSSMMDGGDEKSLANLVRSIPDPAGLFYRYSLASSSLKRRLAKAEDE